MYIIAWRYNNLINTERWDSLVDALDRMVELERQGLMPTIHMR